MRGIVLSICSLIAAGGCSDGFGDVNVGPRIGGQVHGLWDESKVVVHLEAGDVREDLEVAGNGSFQFESAVPPGSSYAVSVVTTPESHTCEPESNTGAGLVLEADVASVSIGCTGPAVDIKLSSAQWTWDFDPRWETQPFPTSIFVQDVTLTIGGPTLTSASINGLATALDTPTAPIMLPLGPTTLSVALATSTGLTKTYRLVFERGVPALQQSAYVKASDPKPDEHDEFGMATALDGDTLVVGAYERDGGAVFVFTRSGTAWTQQKVFEASSLDGNFGISVALSGNTLVVGAPTEDCDDAGALKPGAAHVFVRDGTKWTKESVIKETVITASNGDPGDCFGTSVAVSGETVVVGAPTEDSGITGNPNDNNATDAGAVYVFARSGTTWSQRAYIKEPTPETGDLFGTSVALSGETSKTLVVGAPGTDDDNGAAHVFVGADTAWNWQRSLEASNPGDNNDFGFSVALSGNSLAVGAPGESSATTGINGEQDAGRATGAGAVYVFVGGGTAWTQTTYVKASNTGAGDDFGSSVALSGDVLAVGAPDEDSAATGVNDRSPDTITDAGAVYVFQRIGGVWKQQAYVKASNTGQDCFGSSVALSENLLVVGARLEDSGNETPGDDSAMDAGAVYVFR